MTASVVHRVLVGLTKLHRSLNADLLKHEEIDVTGPQMFLLFYVSKREKCKLTDIAERFDVKPSAVTVMVDRLEKRGYLRRMQDPGDRRSTLVEVTPDGRDMLETAVRVRSEILNGFLSKLEPAEAELVAGFLEKMVGPLDETDLESWRPRGAE